MNFEYKIQDVMLPLYYSSIRSYLEHKVYFLPPSYKKDIDLLSKVLRRPMNKIPSFRVQTYMKSDSNDSKSSLKTKVAMKTRVGAIKNLKNFDKVARDMHSKLIGGLNEK